MHFRPITISKRSFVFPTWDEMGTLLFDLSKKIIESGKSYDCIIVLAKESKTIKAVVGYLKKSHAIVAKKCKYGTI